MDAAVIALIGTIFGGVGLKVVEHWLNRAKDKSDAEVERRAELRAELAGLKLELREAEQALDAWREKYFALLDQFIQVKNELKRPMPGDPE